MNGQKIIYGSDPSPPVRDKELLRIKTIKPIALVQDELVVYKDRVTFIFKEILGMKRVVTEPVRQIVEVEVNESFLYATLKVTTRARIETEITNLRRSEAERARKLIVKTAAADTATI